MDVRKDNALMIAILLAVAATACLGVGLRLLAISGGEIIPFGETSETHIVAALSIIGGVVVFLLGAIALMGARRFALSPSRPANTEPPDLELIDIQAWGQELADIRDHLRQDLVSTDTEAIVEVQELEIPATWRAKGQYLVDDQGRSQDPLAELKRTRDQLMAAAERVDAIVKSIDDITKTSASRDISKPSISKIPVWFRRWKRG